MQAGGIKHRLVGLAGNPNVGKSTVFNALTGMKQHTGNWPGKTVSSLEGHAAFEGVEYTLCDLPGCYSVASRSQEEEAARDFLCFGGADAVIVVCDATCLGRNLILVLQIMEMAPRTVVCVNLLDEAKKKGIAVDLPELERRLGVPVVGCCARDNRGLDELLRAVERVCSAEERMRPAEWDGCISRAAKGLIGAIADAGMKNSAAYIAQRLMQGDESMLRALSQRLDDGQRVSIFQALKNAKRLMADCGMTAAQAGDTLAAQYAERAQELSCATVKCTGSGDRRDRRIDRVLTSPWAGFPVMFLLLSAVLYITIVAANYPSEWLSKLLFSLGDRALEALERTAVPWWIYEPLMLGVYRVLAWVVCVMLPPMLIFFPLFTLLEDLGYLPRVAFNLDRCFRCCNACGKQALTMSMGLGCNAVGVTGCRIIDSPRERLIAMLTNAFMPCNGRFPLMIAMITMFFAAGVGQAASAVMLSAVIALGVAATLAASKLLSKTVLKGMPSSFTLELPPYRAPQVGRVIVSSVMDRTLFVLGRAAKVAAPAGLIIWLMANIDIGGASLLACCAKFLDPVGRFMGLDGVILMAFILALPANEIVLPIIIMAYTAAGTLVEVSDMSSLRMLLDANGWTPLTAVCTVLFSLMHWPCSTTLITIRKESGGWKWAAAAFVLPTVFGVLLCALAAGIARLV